MASAGEATGTAAEDPVLSERQGAVMVITLPFSEAD